MQRSLDLGHTPVSPADYHLSPVGGVINDRPSDGATRVISDHWEVLLLAYGKYCLNVPLADIEGPRKNFLNIAAPPCYLLPGGVPFS